MKRQISICIFLSIVLILIVLLFIKLQNEDGQNKIEQEITNSQTETEDNNSQSITISNDYKTYYFYAINEGGHIFVYDIQSQTLYMETGLETESLPENIQNELETGIYFENEEQLFSFLESYSS